MSHGRIFMFITGRKDIENDDYYCPFNEEQMRKEIPGCDYVTLESKNKFLDDLDWLSKRYGIPVKLEKVRKDNGREITVGVIDSEGLKKLKEELIAEKSRRIELIRYELKMPEEKISMWGISYDAYGDSCFYFVSDDATFSNEMGFLEDYLSYELPKEIIITESYDYHV